MNKLVLAGFVLLAQEAFSQVNPTRDSLAFLIKQQPGDTTKVFTYYQYGETFETENPDSALFYYQQGKDLAAKLKYRKGVSSYVSYAIVILNNKGKFREALQLCTDLLEELKKAGSKNELAAAYINTGSEWQYLSELETAAECYLQAAKLAEETGNDKFQRVANNNLASVFNSLQQYGKGKHYAGKSLLIAQKMKDDYAIASSTINIATSDFFLKNYNESLQYFRQVELLGKKMEDDIIIMDGWLGMADNYKESKEYQQSEVYYRNVMRTADNIGAPEYKLYGYMGLSDLMIRTKEYEKARPLIEKGIVLAQQLETKIELRDIYFRATQLYEATGNTTEALQYYKKYVALNDSLLNEKNMTNINRMEIKYETAKKEQQLTLQKAAIRQKNTLNYILLTGIVALLLISFLSYRTYKQKRTLQEHKISELEKEKLLLATQSILKGQEDERSRLAKDLHDGLGGLLSGVKLQLGAMKGNLILSEEHGRSFNMALSKLDESISEMRRVAHNMMPEALVKLGLQQALQDYCDGLSEGQPFTINCAFHDLEQRMEPSVEITVYRIVQELLNNAVKHSGATAILAQVMRQENNLTITVEDNGKGFDKSTVLQGAGLKNIHSRVDYLKGQLDIQSVPGNGTSIHIECLIGNNE